MTARLAAPILAPVFALILAACAPLPRGPAVTVAAPSPNFDERKPNYVVIHDTSNDRAEDALRTLTDPARKVSAHWLIGRDGTLYQLVDERQRAWHAGVSHWGGQMDMNSASLGIELDNNGAEPYPEAQIARLLDLLRELRDRYNLPPANFLGHGDVAPRRKLDPSRHFPWQRLAEAGFGLWCPAVEETPAGLDPVLLLQAVGYETADPAASLRAFRRHFGGEDRDGAATAEDIALLHCIARQKAQQP